MSQEAIHLCSMDKGSTYEVKDIELAGLGKFSTELSEERRLAKLRRGIRILAVTNGRGKCHIC